MDGSRKSKKDCKKFNTGSIALEAAITIPIFISVILSISLFIKVIFTYEVIQNAISETANEISTYSYLYYLSGTEKINSSIKEKIDQIKDLDISADIPIEIYEDEEPFLDTELSISFDIPEELKYLLYSFVKGAYDETLNKLCTPIIKLCMRKHLTTDEIKNSDERLRMLNIVDGFKGLDFSMSKFFEDDNDNINIVVKYQIDIPTPVKIFPPLTIIQKASVRGWLGGDKQYNLDEEEQNEQQEDIWSLDNFTRGRKIRELFGANLPFTFPTIASFDYNKGIATMIKSMDLTAASYQHVDNVSKKIMLHIDELKFYRGQETPWGKDGIVIKNTNIIKRQLILIIPNNQISPDVETAIQQCRLYAQSQGISLIVEKYGYKREQK